MGGAGVVPAGPEQLLSLVLEILQAGPTSGNEEEGRLLVFRKDCGDLVRRISLLTHFLEELKDQRGSLSGSRSSASWWGDLGEAFMASKNLLAVAGCFKLASYKSDGTAKEISFQFQCVTWKLEKALAGIPYDQIDISEEVQEQVELVRSQLRRATERYGSMESRMITSELAQPVEKEVDQGNNGVILIRSSSSENSGSIGSEVTKSLEDVVVKDGLKGQKVEVMEKKLEGKKDGQNNSSNTSMEELKKSDSLKIPVDFRCPISLDLMRDPVIVSTGQTYERSYIQRWVDKGNTTCPKTQQKLEHFTLTPNYVLRSLISSWCLEHRFNQPTRLANGRIKRSDNGDITVIQAVVGKLSSQVMEERKAAVAEIRSLSNRNTDNWILIAEAMAIPVLVNLLTAEDMSIQENAITSILNLSMLDNNKGLIMLADAVSSIVQVLKSGTVEARENAAVTLFSLSSVDENKITIGASGAIPALVELLENGSPRGRKDAATALFSLCIYQGNKGRAVRAGIVTALLKMLTDTRNGMVDEALTILSVLASNQEAKLAIVKANTIPVLIDSLRTGQPRNKENAVAIVYSLCKRDPENLACIRRLGALMPLTELAISGSERAKRKACSLLGLLN